jgi:hypothetical protein
MKRLNNLFFYNIFIIFSSSLIVKKIFCDNWEYKLVHNLLNGYETSIRPSMHHNLTLNVTFGLALVQIIDVVWNFFPEINNSSYFFFIKKTIFLG